MNTPETSALAAADWHLIDDDHVCAGAYWRMVRLSREMEADRKNLVTMRDRIKDQLTKALECVARLSPRPPEAGMPAEQPAELQNGI